MLGFVSTIFLLIGDSEKECVQNVKSSLALFKTLGFVVHPTKSVLIPLHKITYLGFEIDSQSMTVVPTLKRKQRILSTASKLLTGSSSTVRELAQFVGQVVSCFQGVRVKFGPFWYHKITYLGFEIDSQSMTVVPTLERKRGILKVHVQCLQNSCGLVQSHPLHLLSLFKGQLLLSPVPPLHPLSLFKGQVFRADVRILISFRDTTLVYITAMALKEWS